MQLALPFFQNDVGGTFALGQERLERLEIDRFIVTDFVDDVLPPQSFRGDF